MNIHQIIELCFWIGLLDIAGFQGGFNEVLRFALDFVLDTAGDPSFGLTKRSGWIVDPTPAPWLFWLDHLRDVTFLACSLQRIVFIFVRSWRRDFRMVTQLPLGFAA